MLHDDGRITEAEIAERLSTISVSPASLKHEKVSLDMSGSSLCDISILSQFPSLQSIDISSNQITSLVALSPLEQLRLLFASRNRLTEFPDFVDGVDEDAYPRLLTKVDLSFNEIGSIRSDIDRYRYISDLNLQSNSLTSLEWCRALTNLQILNVSHNQIISLQGLQGSQYLTQLNISHNALISLEIADPIPSLRYVDASRNQINHVNGIADCFINLAVLDLADNTVESLMALADLSDLPLLRDLNLKANAVVSSENYRSELVFLLSDLERLDHEPVTSEEILQSEITHGEHDYSLEGIEIDSRHGRHGITAADTNRRLNEFWYRCAESGFLAVWEPYLRQARSTPRQSLTIDRIPIGIVGLKAVADAVLESPAITSLTLRHCLDPDRWSSIPQGLLAAFRHLPRTSIRHVTLQGCHLSYEDAEFLAELVDCSPVLTNLCLSDNRLGRAPMVQIPGGKVKVGESFQFQRLLQSAANSRSLTHLDLSNNEIIGDGEMALALARLIVQSINLVSVNLSRNRLTYARPVFVAFASARSLQTVDLSSCEIDPDLDPFALQQIGKSFKLNAKLIALDLSHNRLGDTGLDQLAQTAAGSQLQRINLQNCHISDKGMSFLGQWLHSMPSLLSLNIAHNCRASAQSLSNLVRDLLALPALTEVNFTGNQNDLLGSYLELLSKGNITVACISHSNQDLSSSTDIENSTTFPASLTHLDLSNHVLSNPHDDFIADLVRHPNLMTLNLFGCQLSSSDVSMILSSVNLVNVNLGGPYTAWDNLPTSTTIPSIRVLDLSHSCLFSQGVTSLSLAMSDTYCNLEQICLNGSRLGDELSFKELLKAMKNVHTLVLSNCALTDTNYKDLCEIALKHRKLQVLDLSGNIADRSSMAMIADLIQSNMEHLWRIRIPGLMDAEGSSPDTNRTAEDFLSIFNSSLRSNEFLCEFDASELNVDKFSSAQKSLLADALYCQKGSRLSRLIVGSLRSNTGNNSAEEEDLLDNRISSKLALGSLLSTVNIDDWTHVARV